MLLEKILNNSSAKAPDVFGPISKFLDKYGRYFLFYGKEYRKLAKAINSIRSEMSREFTKIKTHCVPYMELDPYKYKIIRKDPPLQGQYRYDENLSLRGSQLDGRICVTLKAVTELSISSLVWLVKHEAAHRMTSAFYNTLGHDIRWFRFLEDMGEFAPCLYTKCTGCGGEFYVHDSEDAKEEIDTFSTIQELNLNYVQTITLFPDRKNHHKCFKKETKARIIPITIHENRMRSAGMQEAIDKVIIATRNAGLPLTVYNRETVRI